MNRSRIGLKVSNQTRWSFAFCVFFLCMYRFCVMNGYSIAFAFLLCVFRYLNMNCIKYTNIYSWIGEISKSNIVFRFAYSLSNESWHLINNVTLSSFLKQTMKLPTILRILKRPITLLKKLTESSYIYYKSTNELSIVFRNLV